MKIINSFGFGFVSGRNYYEASVDEWSTGLLYKKESLEFAKMLLSEIEGILTHHGISCLEQEISTVDNVLSWLIKDTSNENN